jgi:outer membrane protein TolC
VARALAASHDLRVQRDNVELAGEATRRARGAYDTQLRVDARARARTDPVNSVLSGAPDGALAPRATGTFGAASVSQLFGNGASLAASTSVSRDTSNGRLALLTPSWVTALTVDLRVPLLQGRDIDAARRLIRIAAVDRTRSLASVARAAADTVAAVERAYWTVIAARRDAEVRQRAVALAERQLQDTRARLAAGTAAEADLAPPLAEIERRRGDLLLARENLARAEHALKHLLTDSPGDPFWLDTLVPVDPPDGAAPRVPDVAEAVRAALANRPELREARVLIDRQQVEIEAAADRLRPSLDLVVGYALRGLAGSENGTAIPIGGIPVIVPGDMEGGLPQSWATLFTHRFADVSAGVAYSIPIGHTAAKADLASARIARRQAETLLAQAEHRVAVEVRNALVGLATTGERIVAARAAREAAEAQLQAEQDRYDAGLTTSCFVLTRQDELARASLAETAALIDQRKAYAEYLRATGALLDHHGVALVEGGLP